MISSSAGYCIPVVFRREFRFLPVRDFLTAIVLRLYGRLLCVLRLWWGLVLNRSVRRLLRWPHRRLLRLSGHGSRYLSCADEAWLYGTAIGCGCGCCRCCAVAAIGCGCCCGCGCGCGAGSSISSNRLPLFIAFFCSSTMLSIFFRSCGLAWRRAWPSAETASLCFPAAISSSAFLRCFSYFSRFSFSSFVSLAFSSFAALLSAALVSLRLELRHVGDQSRHLLYRPGDGLQESRVQFLRQSADRQGHDVVLGLVLQPFDFGSKDTVSCPFALRMTSVRSTPSVIIWWIAVKNII